MNTWDFTRVYKDEEAFNKAAEKCKADLKLYPSFQGTLNNEAAVLKFYQFDDAFAQEFYKLFTYASMKSDIDQKNPKMQALQGMVYDLLAEYSQVVSFAPSELLLNGHDNFNSWIKNNKEFAPFAFTIDKLFHNEKYTFGAELEAIMANYNLVTSNYNHLYDMLAVADGHSVDVTISDGRTLTINQSNYRSYLEELKSQDDRKLVFEAVFAYFEAHKTTFAGIYNGVIQSDIAESKNRHFETVLDSFLYSNNIPTDVYMSLIKTVKENTKPLKEYMELRRKYFKLETHHMYDRFLNFASSSAKYTYDEGKKLFFDAASTIGGEFYDKAQEVLADGRVDLLAKDGKRTGAYSTGYYDVGPFILLNNSGSLDDVFTLAHEAGHSIHTMFANENQTFADSNYTIFVAEIASTFNEQLLLDKLMETTTDKDTKLVLLQSAIDGLIGTFYRQTLFADFEYQAHELVVKGETVTAEALSNIMKQLYLDYYNLDLNKDPLQEYEWAYIPHFYHSPFYVYQYATCFASSLEIYSRVKNKVPGSFEAYISMLKAGGSKYPVEIVKMGGVDLTTPEPFVAVVKRFEYLLNELKEIIK